MNLGRLEEVIELCRKEIDNNNKNIYATLNIEDLVILDLLIKEYKYLKLKEENSVSKELIENIEKDLYEKFVATGSYEKDYGTPYQERLAGGISCINKIWKSLGEIEK